MRKLAIFLVILLCLCWASCTEEKKTQTVPPTKPQTKTTEKGSTGIDARVKGAVANPKVKVKVMCQDEQAKREIEDTLVSELRRVKGVTLVTSGEDLSIEVVAAVKRVTSRDDIDQAALSVVLTSPIPQEPGIAGGKLLAHEVVLTGLTSLREVCKALIKGFEMSHVAPNR